ncbi:hypothetical protein AGDE_13901 [Angomonas deanei]|uniref:Uncharacterized protein n=1 Tax=Angomonas deanei TaxID=59799 RepID=A0A7G2CN38_9TRYP|nr:hypothetical protein AGDE_13901 [Angomonas deanei]CAD2220855.1 hypothetical protein, conserved [Angomonas deanei]|eukprot:EPY21622.1 hypothetical protein AGDE_13901 [Angomonas deanei]
MANVKPKPKPEENTTKVEEEQEIQDDWSLNGLTDLKGMDLNPLTRTSITFTGENRVGVKPIDSTSFQNRFLYEAIGIHPEDDPENVLPDRPDPGGDYKPGNFPSVKSILSASSFSKDKDLSRKASTNSNSFVVSEAPKKKVEEKRSVSEPSPKKKPIPPAPPQVKPKAAPRAAVEKKSVPAKKKTAGVKRYASTGGKKGGVSPSKGAPKRQVDQMDIFDAIYDEFVSSDSEAGSAASSIVSIPADFLDILYSGNEASSPPPPTESTGASSSSSPVVIAREADPPSPCRPTRRTLCI